MECLLLWTQVEKAMMVEEVFHQCNCALKVIPTLKSFYEGVLNIKSEQ
jgi:hypothetical protein